ncbi:hypothetical protein MTO96_043636 [Rhipicephalus appendiculatus]
MTTHFSKSSHSAATRSGWLLWTGADTGPDVTVIPLNKYERNFKNLRLEKPAKVLKGLNQQELPVCGMIAAVISHRDTQKSTPLRFRARRDSVDNRPKQDWNDTFIGGVCEVLRSGDRHRPPEKEHISVCPNV